jgi:hypothetical protein
VEGDNYLMGFYKETGSFPGLTRHIYVQKFDGNGAPVWASDVLASNSNGISPFNNFTIASDGANGIILAWTDDRNGDNNIDAAVQRVLNDGTIPWPSNGSVVSTSTSNSHQNPQILGVNNDGEVLVTWSKKNTNQSQTAIAGQKFSPSGALQWTNSGIEFIPMSADVSGTIGGRVFGSNSAIIVYDVYVGGSSSNIKALGVDNAGALIWSPTSTLVAGRSTSKIHVTNSGLYNDQLIVVWEEGSTASDIYMQNIFTDGSIGTPPISSDATLSDLTVDGATVEGFNPSVLTYNVPIPLGDPLPVTGATPNYPAATVDITQAVAVPGTSTTVVTAEDGVTQLTYTINFYVAGTDATLNDLTVDGITIPGFSPEIYTYDYQVATGDPIPVVGATPADTNATMNIIQATTLPGTATVEVTAEDGTTMLTYTVNFLYTPSSDATLSDLQVMGATINGFDPDIYDYTYGVIYPSPSPVVHGIPNDPNATVVETQCTEIPCDATVEVTAEDGVTILVYTVSFFYLGYDATLSDLTVDGITIPGFDPEVFNYEYVVNDTLTIPVVDGTTNDPLATLTVTQAPEIPGFATLYVVAEDGYTELTYTVYFYTIGTDATLSDLTLDGISLEGFDPETTYYEVDLQEGDPIPFINGTTNDTLATMEVTQASAVPGDGTLLVTAQDGITQMTYTVHFNLITGISEKSNVTISAYPNPFRESITIKVDVPDEDILIDFANLYGTILHTLQVPRGESSVTWYARGLPEGIYIARVHSGEPSENIIKVVLIK